MLALLDTRADMGRTRCSGASRQNPFDPLRTGTTVGIFRTASVIAPTILIFGHAHSIRCSHVMNHR